MTYLLIDNSNTRTKFVLASPEGLQEPRIIIPTREITTERLNAELGGICYDFAVISSVVPRVEDILSSWVGSPFLSLHAGVEIGAGIDYPNPKQIGADRLANAAGVTAHYGVPCIVVDFGTAVTFDVIDGRSMYVGGVIAPGLASMGDYLSRNTALLPAINPHEPKHAIGKSTEEAMHAGAVYGYRGLVREILGQLIAELGVRPHIIATGGDAALIARGVDMIDVVDTDITLKGLLAIAKLHVPG